MSVGVPQSLVSLVTIQKQVEPLTIHRYPLGAVVALNSMAQGAAPVPETDAHPACWLHGVGTKYRIEDIRRKAQGLAKRLRREAIG